MSLRERIFSLLLTCRRVNQTFDPFCRAVMLDLLLLFVVAELRIRSQ